MDLEHFTERSKGCLQQAQTLARRKQHQHLTPVHLMQVLSDDPTIQSLLQTLKLDKDETVASAVRGVVEAELAKIPQVQGTSQLYVSSELNQVFDTAQRLAQTAGDTFVTVERLLQGVLAVAGPVSKLLRELGLDDTTLNAAINHMRKGRRADNPTADDQFEAPSKCCRAARKTIRC